jgi:hypothetical protein
MAIEREKSQVHFSDIGAIYMTGNGNDIRYKKINGIYYHADTADAVVEALERARANCSRIRIYYGDLITGRDWLEEHDVEGYLGNSLGPLKVPLLICNRRSLGGAALLDHCIVKSRMRQGTAVFVTSIRPITRERSRSGKSGQATMWAA